MVELKFPTEITATRAEVQRSFMRLEHTRAPRPEHHFAITVEKEWRAVAISSEEPSREHPEAVIALLRRPGSPEAEIELRCRLLAHEIHPADALAVACRAGGLTILEGRSIPSVYGLVGDVLATGELEGEAYAHRILATKDGPRLFLLDCRTRRRDYPALAEEFLMAVKSFELTAPTREHFAEPMEKYSFELPLPAAFIFPKSWTHRPDPTPPPGGASCTLARTSGESVLGHLSFAALPARLESSAASLAGNYVEELRAQGIEMAPPRLEKGAAPKGPAWVFVETARAAGGNILRVAATILEVNGALVLFAVLGPHESVSLEEESINRRAYQIALASFLT